MRMTFLSRAGSAGLFDNAAAQTLKHRSVRGAAVTFGGQIVRFACQFGGQVALARLLDPVDFGLLAMVTPLSTLVFLFNDLGLAQATVQRPEITRRDVSSLFWINVAASLAMCLVMAAVSPAVGWFYHEPRTVPLTIALSFALILGGLSSQQIALLGRAMRFRQLANIDVASSAAGALAGITAALAGMGYWSLVVVPYAQLGSTVALSWCYTGWLPGRPARNAEVAAMMRFGGHTTGANFLNFFSRNLDNVLIGRVYGSATLGLYDRAYKLLLLPLSQISAPVARVAVPLLSRLQNDPPRYRAAYLQMLQAIHLAAFPGMITALAVPHAVVLTLFGQKWVGVAPILTWLAIAALPSFVGNSTGWLFSSQGRTASQLRWGMVSATLFVSSFIIGLPSGAIGVARAYACVAVLVQGPLLWWGVTRAGPVKLGDLLGTLGTFLFAGLCALGVLALCKHQHHFRGISGFLTAGATSYLVSLGALWLLPQGRQIIRNVLALRSMLRRSGAAES
jgi:PST family polysaccharide transporter